MPFFCFYGKIKEKISDGDDNLTKFKSFLFKLWRVIKGIYKAISITLNTVFYLVYFLYLIYAIIAGVGTLWVNAVLAVMTVAFIVFYIVLRLSKKSNGRRVKHLKQYYKIFKLIAKLSTALTAIYALFTAIKHVHPVAMFLALFGVVFLLLRLWFGIIFNLVGRTIDKVFDSITGRISKTFTKRNEDEYYGIKKTAKSKQKLIRKKQNRDTSNDIIIPLDECLLSDVEDEEEVF